MMKRIIALLLALILTVGLLPTVALAAEPTAPTDETPGEDAVSFTKDVVTKNGQDMIKIEAYVNGDVKTQVTTTPCDIVLVLDQSGSMAGKIKAPGYDYTKVSGDWSYNRVNSGIYYYHCDRCEDYHKVEAEWDYSFDGPYYYLVYDCPYNYNWDMLYNGSEWWRWDADDTIYTGTLYTRTETAGSNKTKVEALKEAANTFLQVVSESATANKVNHRVSIVGFGSAGIGYTNTEVLSVEGYYSSYQENGSRKHIGQQYSSYGRNRYKNSLVAINSGTSINPMLTNAVKAVEADGATAVDLGLDMASRVFSNQDAATQEEYTDGTRAKIVVVVTDGIPTHSRGLETKVASTAINTAGNLEKNGAKVFAVGIALDTVNEEDGGTGATPTNAKNFISWVSSDYPDATSWENHGDPITGAPKYGIEVSTADSLKSIFADIAKESTNVSASATLTKTAVMSDTLSGYFNLPAKADSSSIEVYTSAASYDSNGALTWGTETEYNDAQVTISADKKTISVTNFDYTANCVTEKAKAKEGNDFGKKLVIYIPIEKDATKAQFGGYLPTNDDATLNDPKGNKGYKADGAHKDCTVVAPTLNGKNEQIDAGSSYSTTDLFTESQWPDGSNNAGVEMVYTIRDSNGATVATKTVPAGKNNTEIEWVFVDDKQNSNTYPTPGTYTFTIDCTVSCTNPKETTKHTATSTIATGTITVKPTTATVTLTKEITGALSDTEKQSVLSSLKVYAKSGETARTEFEKGNDGKYSATLTAGTYTIEEEGHTVEGYDCTATLGEGLSFTVVAGVNQNLTLTNNYTAKQYTIRYEYTGTVPNGAPSAPASSNAAFKSEQEVADAPTLDGWTFSGWTTDDVTVTDGKFNMPNNNVVFTGSWTQRATATINYVVVPTGAGTLSSYSETKYVDDTTTTAAGSTATAGDGYRFVGWYDNANCTGDALTTAAHYTPQKSEDKWTGATYYAKFEAIPTPGADDLPKVNVICTNTVMGHAASENNALVVGTYTVDGTQYASGIYTCKVKLNVIQGYIDTYNTSNSGHTDDAANANLLEITLTYDATDGTWMNSTGNFKIYVVCNTTEFDVTYNWTGLDDATFESAVKPELPSKAKVTKGGKYTVDTDYKAGDIRVATNGDKYRFSGWSTTDASIVSGEITNIQNNITITGTWTKLGSGTFDLNDKIFKVFDEADGSRDIPRSSYTFEVKVTRLDKETNELTDEKYTGTVTLDGATAAATPSFVFNDPITFHTGDEYRFLVEEKSNTVTALSSDERIDYDNAEYYLYVTVSDDLKTINYRFEHVLVITSAEEEPAATENQPITFHNYYYAAKDPGTYDINFSDLVFKVLTKTGDRSFNGAEFTANVDGWRVHEIEIAMVRASAGFGFEPLNSVSLKAAFPADITFEADGKAYRGFTGDTLTVTAGRYLFLIDEINDGQTNITYDESKYWLDLGFVENAEGEVSLAGQRVRKFVDGDTYETVLALEDSEWMIVDTSISPVYFENTIDTGKDDYYPIIIPTIINKDTGMLNKTDHFAYVIGYPDGTVHPNGQITRAEVATIFFRLLRDEVRNGAFTTSNTYSDVAYGKWYNNPISTMSALGIITGYPDGTFKPNKPITRAEFAAIAARFDETQSGKSATFSDVIGHWAAKEIGIAYANEWIKGYPDGTFKPDQNITRAEAMTLINRVLERKPESPADLLTNMNKWTDNMDTSKWYYLDVQEATNSHGYTRKTFNYELWRQMLPDPDWSRYER